MRLKFVILILFMWKIRGVFNQFCVISNKMKKIENIVESKWQSEGRGARVRRSIGRPELRDLDPFLMLDEFSGNANNGAGFPDHPHRGFETVSYLLEVSSLSISKLQIFSTKMKKFTFDFLELFNGQFS